MKRSSSSKGLLLEWLLNALDKKLYKGLFWVDTQRKIFCIVWTHKSAEQWSNDDDEPFVAWAEFKGKRNGKNSKQLKATFRCALNSKKDHLQELPRKKGRRYWQFIDPASKEKEVNTRKTRKVKNEHVSDASYVTSSDDSTNKTYFNNSSRGICSSRNDIIPSPKLPNFFCSFASLTPPHQANEISSSFSESELQQRKFNCLERNTKDGYTSSSNDHVTSDIFGRISPSIGRTTKECRTLYVPSPDRSNLTPPLKDVQSTYDFNSFHQPSKDVWQPNGLTTSLAHQDISTVNQFLSNDFDELYNSTIQETIHNRIDFVEMDQSVPVLDIILQGIEPANKNGLYSYTNKTVLESSDSDQKKLCDGNMLSDDLDQETWNIMQELDKFLNKSYGHSQKMDYSATAAKCLS